MSQEIDHDRQMCFLAQDAYIAADVHLTTSGKFHEDVNEAAKNRAPPAGWARLSEHPEKMAEYATRMGLDSVDKLESMLRPDESGFRAEIYLPDEKILGPGYKPTLAFKGSSGTVSTSDGKWHDTTKEDFLANNFPQAIGLKADYYERAMTLASQMKRHNLDFEVTGHSLGGGQAEAAAAVSGARATVFNPANLHWDTVQNFAKEHRDVQIHSVSKTITNYQITGELLNNGVQNNMNQNMTGYERFMLGSVIKEGSQVLHDTPDGRALLKQTLQAGLSEQAQKTVSAFVDKLATGNPTRLMESIPSPMGQVRMLEPYTRDENGQLVPRAQTATVQELTHLAAPLMSIAGAASAGSKVGRTMGEGVAAVGDAHAQVLHAGGEAARWTGDAARSTGQAADTGLRMQGEAEIMKARASLAAGDAMHAGLVDAAGEIKAGTQQAQGWAKNTIAQAGSAVFNGISHITPSADFGQRMQTKAQAIEDAAKDQGWLSRTSANVQAAALKAAGAHLHNDALWRQ